MSELKYRFEVTCDSKEDAVFLWYSARTEALRGIIRGARDIGEVQELNRRAPEAWQDKFSVLCNLFVEHLDSWENDDGKFDEQDWINRVMAVIPEEAFAAHRLALIDGKTEAQADHTVVPGWNGAQCGHNDVDGSASADTVRRIEAERAQAQAEPVAEQGPVAILHRPLNNGGFNIEWLTPTFDLPDGAKLYSQAQRAAVPDSILGAAIAVNAHWNEFGPKYGFDQRMDDLHNALAAAPEQQEK